MENKTPTNEANAFRAFAQKVVSVPKAVIDRREAAYQKSRQNPKKGAKPPSLRTA